MDRIEMEFHWVPSGPDRLATSIDLPEQSGPWPVVVHFHGLSGDRIGRAYQCVEFGRRLADMGIACVRFDHAGCGESTGDNALYSMASVAEDANAIHRFLAADDRFDLSRLGVVGTSLGSLGALWFDSQYRSRCLGLWAPVFNLAELTARVGRAEEAQTALALFGYAPFKGIRLGPAYFEHLDRLDARALLSEGSGRVFVAHAHGDETVPFTESESFVACCNELGRPCEFVALEGEAHDFYEEPLRSQVLETSTQTLARWLVDDA